MTMAERSEKETRSTHRHPPPPCDPFTRYQTPWPRPEHDEQNPFVQFRRFADEQFQSIFSSIPKLFGTGPESFQREIEQMIQRNQEFEEGMRKRNEQASEELKQYFELLKQMHDQKTTKEPPTDAKPVESSQLPWWHNPKYGRAAHCPALNENRSDNARKCPAMFDKEGNPKTELDAYTALNETADKRTPGWFSTFGWDGKQRPKPTTEDRGSFGQDGSVLAITKVSTRWLNPFDKPEHTIPWLLSNPYSPVFLCNPNQRYVDLVELQQGVNQPFRILRTFYLRPRFIEFEDRREQLAKQLPWADAFEDLVSLQQTGKMIDRDYSTYRTPKTWIHEMVQRGSLGPTWGFNEHGQLTKLLHQSQQKMLTDSRRLDSSSSSSLLAPEDVISAGIAAGVMAAASAQEAKDKSLKELVLAEKSGQFDQNVSGQDQPDLVTVEKQISDQSDDVSVDHQQSSAPIQTSQSFSSTTWSSSGSEIQKSDSIISTTTTTERWTRPDGTVESRRVFKRRFADGREVEEETHDFEPRREPETPSLQQMPWPIGPEETNSQTQPPKLVQDKQSRIATPVQDELKREHRQRGWFWN